jgi:hypothetical protein
MPVSMKDILRRLEALELKVNPPPPVYKVVDMKPFQMRLQVGLIAYHDGDKKPEESALTGFARALKFRDEGELFRVAADSAAEFAKRYIAVKPPRYSAFSCADPVRHRELREGLYEERANQANDVREYVVRKFLEEEIVHQCLDDMVWFGNDRPGLCAARPCRPTTLVPRSASV